MNISKMTKEQRDVIINALIHVEIPMPNSEVLKWPSLFSNLIEPRKKDLKLAKVFYDSLSIKDIEKRFAIHQWEGSVWNLYESLMGCSLLPLGKSIDPRKWAEKERLNIEFLCKEGKNQLMTDKKYSTEYSVELPTLYDKLISGDWDSLISLEELSLFDEADSKYLAENNVDFDDMNNIDFGVLSARPRKEQFVNRQYFVAQEIQALLWYEEFLKEIIVDGVTFYPDVHEQKNKPKRKYIDIKKLQRSNNGYEMMKASFDQFVEKNDKIPKWPELMDYMARSSSHEVIVEAHYKGRLVSELHIEGVENPIDRDAFRNRYNRYFK